MVSGPVPICLDCRHYHREGIGLICDAFPKGIPEEIVLTNVVHRKPFPGDHGIQFESREEPKE